MRLTNKLLLFLLFSYGIMLIFSGSAYSKNSLIYGERIMPSCENPITCNDSVSRRLLGMVYKGLVQYALSAEVEPQLVKKQGKHPKDTNLTIESCKCVSTPERNRYEFELKDNIFWHDGSRITAEDVRATYLWAKKKQTQTPYGLILNFLADISINGNKILFTVRPGINHLELFMIPILPRQYCETGDPKYLFGNNSYAVVDKRLDGIILNRKYSNSDLKNPIEEIQMKRITPIIMIDSLLSKNIDCIPEIALNEIERVRQDPSFVVHPYFTNNIISIAINMRTPGLRDHRVREALQLAIDLEKLAKSYFGTSEILSGPLSSGSDMFYKMKIPSRNVAQAQELLRAANFRRKLTLKIEDIKMESAMIEAMIKSMIQQWSEAGITVEWKKRTTDQFNNEVYKRKEFDLAFVADEFTRTFLIKDFYITTGYRNITGYSNSIVDEYLERIPRTVKIDDLRNYYMKIQEQISKDIPYIYLVQEKKYFGCHNRINTGGLIITDNLFGKVDRWECR